MEKTIEILDHLTEFIDVKTKELSEIIETEKEIEKELKLEKINKDKLNKIKYLANKISKYAKELEFIDENDNE